MKNSVHQYIKTVIDGWWFHVAMRLVFGFLSVMMLVKLNIVKQRFPIVHALIYKVN